MTTEPIPRAPPDATPRSPHPRPGPPAETARRPLRQASPGYRAWRAPDRAYTTRVTLRPRVAKSIDPPATAPGGSGNSQVSEYEFKYEEIREMESHLSPRTEWRKLVAERTFAVASSQ